MIYATNQKTLYESSLTDDKVTSNRQWKRLFAAHDSKENLSVKDWWILHGRSWPLLQKVAVQIFSLVCTSATSERNFSDMGFIHSKLRNCLKEEKVDKLVYIKCNAKAFGGKKGVIVDIDEDNEIVILNGSSYTTSSSSSTMQS